VNGTYYFWLAGFVVLIALSLAWKEKLRSLALTALAIYATVFIGTSVVSSFQARARGNAAYVKADRAELNLKLSSGFVAVESYSPFRDKKSSDEVIAKFYKDAIECLDDAIKEAPKSSILRARKIIIEMDRGKSTAEDLKELAKIDSDKARDLHLLLSSIAAHKKVPPEQFKKLETIAGKTVPAGWYRQIVKLQLYKALGEKKDFKKLHQDFLENYMYFMVRLGVLFMVVALAAVAGFFVILAQLFFMKRSPTSEAERDLISAPPGWTWKTVFAVFAGWLCVEFLLGPPLKGISSNLGTIATEQGATMVALMTALLYLLQNLPAIFLIWLLALRPNKLPFMETMKIRTKVGKTGPYKLVAAGVGTWYAAIPVIIATVFLVTRLGFQGSDNPIVAIVLTAAKDASPFGVFLFILTLGVLPALVEEVLFRGFLYTSLRRKLGAFSSIIISAALFSLAHLDLGGAIQLFCLGFLFAFIFEKTKSLIPSMICHCMWNSGMFLMAMMLFS